MSQKGRDRMKTKRSYDLDLQRSNLVVKDNRLIQVARYGLTSTQQKFIAFLISKIKPNDKKLQTFEIRVQDFCELTGIDAKRFYGEIRTMIDDFDENQSFWIDTPTETYKFRWFSDTRYIKGTGTVRVTLAPTLQEYLIGLTANFTTYELYNILALRSKYAIRLFELFKSYAYQRQREFEIENLKNLLLATNYKNFADFEKRVLKPAIHEINEYTELTVSYNKARTGRKFTDIIFFIEKKSILDGHLSYRKTIAKLNSGKVMENQTSLFDD